MKIAILGSVALPVPPPAQGGTEWIAYYQAKGLASLGHKVILFAAKGSKKDKYELVEVGGGDTVTGSNLAMGPAFAGRSIASARQRPAVQVSQTSLQNPPISIGVKASEATFGTPPSRHPLVVAEYSVESSRKLRKENVYLAQVLQQLIDRKDDYDVILNNMRGEAVFLPVAKMLNKPFVNVMHLPIFPELAEIFKEYKTHVITISQAQRKDYQDLNYLATVNNCVDTEQYAFNAVPEDYLLMMGSIAPHKNQAGAIRVAKKLGMKLILAGKINDRKYFDTLNGEIDGKLISWIGELAFPEKLKLYQKAKAFLFPILWEEPFGLVMIEAMACGTPVVAFGNGAIPEVIVDRKTGFVIENDSEEKMVEAVRNIDSINRTDCRKYVEENFSVDKIVGDYEAALSRI